MPTYTVTLKDTERKTTKLHTIIAESPTEATRLMLERLQAGYPEEFERGIFEIDDVAEVVRKDPPPESERSARGGRR